MKSIDDSCTWFALKICDAPDFYVNDSSRRARQPNNRRKRVFKIGLWSLC